MILPHRLMYSSLLPLLLIGLITSFHFVDEEIILKTSDGITIYGDIYRSSAGKSAPMIMLFHQGGANARAEYASIIPKLQEEGYNILAIDQRRGGDWLGGNNRTVDKLGAVEYSYCDAYPDIEAALAYVEDNGYTGKRIVWGSSYSAALVIQLAAQYREDVAGVLAFSPASGDPMEGCRAGPYLADLTVPLLVLRPASEMERESVRDQFEAVQEAGHLTYISENGVHGSSMLNPERVDGSVEEHWARVMEFIDNVVSGNSSVNIPGPSFQDVISLRSAGSPAISPNGLHIAFTVRTVDWKENKFDTEIWLSLDGKEPFQLTRTKDGGSTTPRWSHDGQWLAFLADRGNKTQVYAVRLKGGEAMPLSNAPEGVSNFAWSPDDFQLAYTMTEAQDSTMKTREEQFGAFQIEDADYRMTHLWVVDVDPDAQLAQRESYCPEDPDDCPKSHEPRRLTGGDTLTVTDFAWSPQGDVLSIEHQVDPSIISFMKSDISLVEVETGEVTPLVEQVGYDGNVVWSPDGEWIVYQTDGGNTTSNFYRNSQLALIPSAGGEARRLLEDFDENISGLRWTPEGLFGLAWQKTERGLFHIDVEQNTVTRLEGAPRNVWSIDFSEDGATAALLAQTPTTLSEIYHTQLDALSPAKISNMTTQIAGWDVGTSEMISWESRDGAEIEGVLFKPADFDPDKKYPLLVVIHGGPTGIDYPTPIDGYVYPIPQWLAKGAVVLEPNYRGSAGYGEAFRSLNVRNLGVGDAWDVLSGVDYLVEQGFVDEERMGAMGWSQGGYISAFLTTNTDRFAAISVGAGISNWVTYYVNTDIHPFTRQYLEATPWEDMDIYLKTSPMTSIASASTPTLIQHGEFDRRVPIPNAYELFQGLQDNGVDTKLIVYKGFGHGITKPKERLAAVWHNWQWFARHLWGEEVRVPVTEK